VNFLSVICLRAVASEGDQALGFAANGSGFGARGLDAFMGKELFDKVAAQCKPGARTASKPVTGNLVSHVLVTPQNSNQFS
jgi:hypothetical protein